MKLSRIFAMLLMVLLIVGGTVIVISWAQTSPPPLHYRPASRASITFDPNTGTIHSGGFAGSSAPAIQWAAPAAVNPEASSFGLTATAAPKRPWSVEQACGPPDTTGAGDYPTAWASRNPDDNNEEWLSVTYDPPVDAVAVLIYETFNPGAISTVNLYDEQKRLLKTLEHPVAPVNEPKRNLVLPVGTQLDGKVSRIDISVRSQVVPGWNEIDACGLIDAQGQSQWAKTATASSSFADAIPSPGFGYGENYAHEARIQRLEQQVAELRGVIDQLQQRLAPQIRPANRPKVELQFDYSPGRRTPEATAPAATPMPPSGAVPGTSTTPAEQPGASPPRIPGLLQPTEEPKASAPSVSPAAPGPEAPPISADPATGLPTAPEPTTPTSAEPSTATPEAAPPASSPPTPVGPAGT